MLGGWDVVNGLPDQQGAAAVRRLHEIRAGDRPAHLTRWVTTDTEPGLRGRFDALGQLDGAGKAVLEAGFPVMIWEGQDDPAHAWRKAFADANGLCFL